MHVRVGLRGQAQLSSERHCNALGGPSDLQDGQGKLRPVHAQLLSSPEQPAQVLLPVQAQPQLLKGLPQALAGVQRLAARHVQWPLQDIALY